jgi:hypothetical protein
MSSSVWQSGFKLCVSVREDLFRGINKSVIETDKFKTACQVTAVAGGRWVLPGAEGKSPNIINDEEVSASKRPEISREDDEDRYDANSTIESPTSRKSI